MLGPRGDKQRPGFAFSLCLRSEPEELPLLENEVPEPEAPVAAWALGAKNAHSCADGHGRGQPRLRKTNLLRVMGMGINQPFSGLESKGKVPGSPYQGMLTRRIACSRMDFSFDVCVSNMETGPVLSEADSGRVPRNMIRIDQHPAR